MVTQVHRLELAAVRQRMMDSGVQSVLEIGSRFGISLMEWVQVIPTHGKLVAVDLPGGPWGEDSDGTKLRELVDYLRADGYNAHLILGDSRDEDVVQRVAMLGPFDAVYVDGDHRYESVLQDYENYGHLALKMIVFDDIRTVHTKTFNGVECECGVPRLWEHLKTEFPERMVEIDMSLDVGKPQGKGVLYV